MVEADVYRVSDLAIGTELPQVWLTPTHTLALERALRATRACVSIRAQPDAATTSTAQISSCWSSLRKPGARKTPG